MVSTPIHVLKGAALRLIQVPMDKSESPDTAIEEFIGYATKTRKNGLCSLEDEHTGPISAESPTVGGSQYCPAGTVCQLRGLPRLPIAGYADPAPVNNNNTEEQRRRHPRIDLVVLDETGVKGEPERMRAPRPKFGKR